ncbi:FxsA family protein [Oryzicola mucosus]|uniref:Membrane protein FxsA n=1 Tax=Oryzicola mucosus TaxID=2767425 RepID=A0A8J6U472_9HYPH|nr:FxsA family protein [Oryzicola mucosus]MBD0413755.1 membrane protein FxsA [Oryzicola mucosus]
MIALLILLMPLFEIAGFVVVGSQIGVLPTLGLVILSSVVGVLLLRVQGFGVMTRIRAALAAEQDPSREVIHGVMILLAGLLLVIPGFITDIIGLALFLPPVRDLGWKLLRRNVKMDTRVYGFRRQNARDGKTIDLDETDYSRKPNPDSPWRSLPDE